ncbi:arsenate reductase ArsC [Simiduia curdlanivorans]|uniref:Arsenate reductase ArsC n=1 Tax=Simiduia curdlanivorans TaxID=1492769 RepID=A0ABV8V0Z9_9GAMM|nr:arsenate reductase ArsC [Simiduia curdlanivorans]MDN3637621.1 arsenate reductase ArsC [Simiduia curdlanivorans]
MKTVLFVCIHNSARSQMAEAYAKYFGAHYLRAFSAGIEPGKLNPLVVSVMAEEGVDISQQPCRSVADHLLAFGEPDVAITVCDEASAERCPQFSAGVQRLHWSFADPSALAGIAVDRLAATRTIRDQIKHRVRQWCQLCE